MPKGGSMSKKRSMNTKAKILEVSEKIFSEKGFDGARVDEIAKEAEVNKALIYYYFKSKDEILDYLFDELVTDSKRIMKETLNNEASLSYEENLKQSLRAILDFVIERKRIIKVAITESLKSNSRNSIIFKISDMIMSKEMDSIRKIYEEKGMNFSEDCSRLFVTEFFTGVLPIINFAIYMDEWKTYYSINEEELIEHFLHAFKDTHISYHLKNI